jgi:hypothetical protein
MADFNVAQAGALSPEEYAQQQALNRQQRFAEMLMQQNQQPQGQMISGRYVAPSWAQQLQAPINMLVGAYLGKQSDTEAGKLAQKIREAKSAKEEEIANYITGTPEKTTELAGPYAGNVPMPTAFAPATKPNYDAALRAISTNNPYGVGKEEKAAIIGSKIVKPTELQQNYQAWIDSGNKGSIIDYQRQIANLKVEHPSFSHVETPQGMYVLNSRTGQMMPAMDAQGKPIMGKGRTLTEAEGKATTYQGTMMNSAKEMKSLEDKGYNPASFKNQGQLSAPISANVLLPADTQQYKQAMDGFANAYLRFQSGANMAQDEIQRNLRNMMPAFGDKPDTIKQKADARNEAIRFMSYSAGQGANMLQQAAMPNTPTAPTMPAANPATPSAKVATPPMYATNGKTRIVSTDGGNTWQPVGGQ